MKIVTGKAGIPHVSAQQFRQFVEGTVGQESYILISGENLEPELSTNNLLKIRSGMMSHHGNISCVELGTYDEVTIQNGNQGMKRIDLVVNRYSKNDETGIESNDWVVLMGTPDAEAPVAPAYTEGNLQDSDLVDDCPVFEVHLDGINVTEVKKLLSVTPDMSTLNAYLAELDSKLDGIGQTAEVGNYGEWNIPTSDYYQIGNKMQVVNNAYYQTSAENSIITIKQAGIYLVTFNTKCAISSERGTIWTRLTKNNAEMEVMQNNGNTGYIGVAYSKVVKVDAGDKINAYMSATGTIKSTGYDSLSVVRISA